MKAPHLYQVEDGWVEIWPGTQFHFNNPPPEEITPESVAHALAHLCRYNGHTKRFYSVCEHVCLLSDWVMAQPWSTAADALLALHHDDAEFVIGDMARPIKVTMPQFKAQEKIIDGACAERFGFKWPFPAWMHDADARILRDERDAVMVRSPHDWGTDDLVPLGVKFWRFTGWFFWLSRQRYLRRHYRLTRMVEAEQSIAA